MRMMPIIQYTGKLRPTWLFIMHLPSKVEENLGSKKQSQARSLASESVLLLLPLRAKYGV